jgi:hypothetical protein
MPFDTLRALSLSKRQPYTIALFSILYSLFSMTKGMQHLLASLRHEQARLAATLPGGEGAARALVIEQVFSHLLAQHGFATPIAPDAPIAALLTGLRWQLDERLADRQCLTPALLGMLAEQKNTQQLAAYYTDDDVGNYMARNTVVPALLERMQTAYPSPFAPAGPFWRTLCENQARFLPENPGHSHSPLLPHTHNERYLELITTLRNGQPARINDLVSANIDGGALLGAVLANTCDPALLVACWQSMEQISVLDPTCGAGALLLAALRTLAPIGLICLQRMHCLQDMQIDGPPPAALGALRSIVFQAGKKENWPAFVYASLLQHNLFGVDCSAAAVLACRARLLCAWLAVRRPLGSINPWGLSDLSNNIRLGNALVGIVGRVSPSPGPSPTRWGRGDQEQGTGLLIREKEELLDAQLAQEYGIDAADGKAFSAWQASHQPLHWGAAFPTQMAQGGFAAILANPPYLAYSGVRQQYTVRGYSTERCGNLYALVIERALGLLQPGGRCGVIVPIASLATASMAPLQALYAGYNQWHSHWAVRPARLFADVDMNLTISLLHQAPAMVDRYTTGYRRWRSGERGQLFTSLAYTKLAEASGYPKLGSRLEHDLLAALRSHGRSVALYCDKQGATLYYHSGGRYWRKALWEKLSSHYHPLRIQAQVAPIVFALLNSQLFYWYWIAYSNCMDVVRHDVEAMPVFALERADPAPFAALNAELLAAYGANQREQIRRGKQINRSEINFAVAPAKPIIDRIDQLLAQHYGLSPVMLDFVLHYDPYRMGSTALSPNENKA